MAADNLAIEMMPLGDHVVHMDDDEIEVHVGMGGSITHLIPIADENRRSLTASVKSSVLTSVRKTKSCLARVFSPIKNVLFKLKLLFAISLYGVLGAYMFMWLEVPTDLASKEEAFHKRLIARDDLIIRLRDVFNENKENREDRWKTAILEFENDVSLDEPVIESAWTFWMSFLYAGTIFTTIGYGNIACATTAGQVATMVYAIVGIPIMIAILNDLGDTLLYTVKCLANSFSDARLFIFVKLGMVGLEENSQQRVQYVSFSKRMSKFGIVDSTSLSTITTLHDNDDDEEPKRNPPVIPAVCATIGWIMFAGAIFCIWEDWDYFTSIYFFFISTSTIGLGDVTPAHPEYMIATFFIVIVGLSMVNVCISVVCEKIELMYLALLTKMAEDYQRALESGDPDAVQGMMSGFQGQAKFLMPLISKNAGTKVMNQFKQEAKAKGIDIPPVLTNIDSKTGMPAFASAKQEDFKDFIEAAEVKKEEEERIDKAFAEKLTGRQQSPIPRLLVTCATETEGEFVKKTQTFDKLVQWDLPVFVNHIETQTASLEELFEMMKRPQKEVDIQTICWRDLLETLRPDCTSETQTSPPEDIVEAYSMSTQISPHCSEIETRTSVPSGIIEENSCGTQFSPNYSEIDTQTSVPAETIEEYSFGTQISPDLSETETQTSVPCDIVEEYSFGTQISPEWQEIETQTDVEQAKQGVQAGLSVEDMFTQCDLESTATKAQTEDVNYSDCGCQCEPTTSATFVETGIQPEVSSIYMEIEDSEDESTTESPSTRGRPSETDSSWFDDPDSEDEVLRLEELKLLREAPDISDIDPLGAELEDTERMRLMEEKMRLYEEKLQDLANRKQAKEERRQKHRERHEQMLVVREEERVRRRKEKEEERKRKKEFRFMKSSGDQTDFDNMVEEKETATAKTQTKIVEQKRRRTQTKLTCINSTQLKKMEQKRQMMLSSTASGRVHTHSGISASLSSPRSSTQTSTRETVGESTADSLPVAEISLEVDLFRRPVDEYGVEVLDEIGDDNVFYSDEEDYEDEEMELFAVEIETQTERSEESVETQLYPYQLGVLFECSSQTTVSSFRREPPPKEKKRERRKKETKRETTIKEEGADGQTETREGVPSVSSEKQPEKEPGAREAVIQTSEVENDEKPAKSEVEEKETEKEKLSNQEDETTVATDVSKSTDPSSPFLQSGSTTEGETTEISCPSTPSYYVEDEVHFMIETSMQTETSGFIREHREEDTNASSEDLTGDEGESGTRYLVNGSTQTDEVEEPQPECLESTSQTETTITIEMDSQTSIDVSDRSLQTSPPLTHSRGQQSVVTSASTTSTSDTAEGTEAPPESTDSPEVRFMVATSTQSEVDTQESGAQCSVESTSSGVNCQPVMSSSETQVPQIVIEQKGTQVEVETNVATTQVSPVAHRASANQASVDSTNTPIDATTSSERTATQTERETSTHRVGPDDEFGYEPWTEPSSGPLWSDFDVVLQEFGDELETIEEGDEEADERASRASKTSLRRRQTREYGVRETQTESEWIEVYIEELEQKRRKTTASIGIQTGVLTRVQHLYEKEVTLTSEEEDKTPGPSWEAHRPHFRRLESMDQGMKRVSSDESLQLSRPQDPPMVRKLGQRRSSSFKKPDKRAERRSQERQATVQDLRSRFEKTREGFKRDSSTD